MHASQLRASETKEEFVNQIKIAQLSGKALYETIHQRKDGSTFPVEISLRAIQSEGKRFYQAVIRDITERKEAERSLQESERKYRELVEYANSIILHWTNDGKITFLNEFGQRFFGYSAEEIIGRHVIGTIVPTIDSVGHDLIHLMDQICDDPIAFEKTSMKTSSAMESGSGLPGLIELFGMSRAK
jgi:PAS domain S-box